jgi:TusE/DsrC/DsvC family sulfur relay protein
MNATFIPDKLEKLEAQMAWLVEREQKKQELLEELTPVLREVLATTTGKLDEFEKRGWFAFVRELARVGERVLDHYSAEDVRALGDAIITILDTVRAMTQPDVLAIVEEAAESLRHADQAKPIGMVGMVRASRSKDVRKGMAVLMSLLGHVGRAAQKIAPPKDDRRERLAKMLGPKRKPEPKRLPAPAAPVVAPVAPAVEESSEWTRELAQQRAAEAGITLSPEHWNVIDAARAEFEKNKAAANIRRLTQITGLGTRELYALFPKAPGRTIARIAGTPKPAGCI